jgi:hypothetical protein
MPIDKSQRMKVSHESVFTSSSSEMNNLSDDRETLSAKQLCPGDVVVTECNIQYIASPGPVYIDLIVAVYTFSEDYGYIVIDQDGKLQFLSRFIYDEDENECIIVHHFKE